jgi:hypothetical protein
LLVKSLVIIPDTMLQSLNKTLIIDMVEMGLKILQVDVEEEIRLFIRNAMRQEIVNSQATLSPRRYKNNNRLRGRVFLDSKVGGLGHSDHK